MPTPPRPDSCEVAWEVAPDVYCLGPRGRTQTDVYFIRSGSSWALIDTGWAHDGPSIKRAAEAVFGAGARPASILLTHCHPDHAGSALQLARAWECAVYVHPQELPIATGDFTAMTDGAGPLDVWVILPLMRAVGQRRREAMLSKSSLRDVVRPLEPDPGIPGLPGWSWIPTPGHTPGHVSFLRAEDRIVITGDALVTMQVNTMSGLLFQHPGLSGPPWYTTWSRVAARESIARICALAPVVVAGGHGIPMTGAATADAVRAFTRRVMASRGHNR